MTLSKLIIKFLVRIIMCAIPASFVFLAVFILAGMNQQAFNGGLIMFAVFFHLFIEVTEPRKDRGEW